MQVAQFRQRFPAFSAAQYPDSAVQIRLSLAAKFFASDLWTDSEIREHAIGLYAAHFLWAYGSPASGGSGAGSGTGLGVVASKSVDGASVSYDTSSGTETNAGFWNTTPYGKELWQLMRVFGGGARQL